MSLATEIEFFRDPDTGMIHAADGGRDNLILNTATLISLLSADESKQAWARDAAIDFLISSEVQPGLYKREPTHTGSNSVDNLIAAACVSQLIAWDIAEHGRKHRWCFNVERPGTFELKHWYGRFLGVPAFVRLRARDRALFDPLLFSIACVLSTFSKRENTSDKCLQRLMNEAIKGEHWLCDLAIRVWNKLMQRKYPGGLAELYGVYFGPLHPFARHAPREFT